MKNFPKHFRSPRCLLAILLPAGLLHSLTAPAAPQPPGSKIIPVEVASALAAEHGALDPDVFHSAEVLPLTGKVIHIVKGVSAGTKQPVGSCMDASGATLVDCGKALRRAERLAYYQDFGAISPQLWQTTQGAAESQQFRVLIWLTVYEPPIKREDLKSNPEYAAVHIADAKARRQAAQDLLKAATEGKAIGALSFASDAPYALAYLNQMEILALAKMPGVAQIYLSEPRKPSSEAYVGTVKADITEFTGYGSKVCIVEPQLPQTPNTLYISTDASCTQSTTSAHSRRVAGMVHAAGEFPFGTAKEATVYVSGFDQCNGGDPADAITWCAYNKNSDVLNVSFECSSGDNRLLDYWTKQPPYLTFDRIGNFLTASGVCSSGGEVDAAVGRAKLGEADVRRCAVG